MKDLPPERIRRHDEIVRRIERNLLFTLTTVFIVLWLVGAHSMSRTAVFASLPGETALTEGWIPIFGILALISLNGLFVLGETAVDLLRPIHLRQVKDLSPSAQDRLQRLLDRKQKYVAACSVGSQTARLALVFVGFLLAQGLAVLASEQVGWTYDFRTILLCALAVAVPVALLNLVLGELVPKSFAAIRPASVGVRLYRFIRFTSVLLSPLSSIVVAVANVITSRFGGSATFALTNQAEEEIKNLVESAQETGEIEVDEKELLHSVFEFTDTVAREVMTPRVDMDAMSIESDPAEVVRVIQESGHSRIPLYEDTDDQIVGIIHAKDLLMAMLRQGSSVSLRSLMRPALFIPENKNLHELLAELRATRSQLAVVQDEFGGTAGIVTIEDIIEELVGDIVDEYDVEEPEFETVEGGTLIDGRAHLDDVNSVVGSTLNSDEFDTIGGYVFGLFGRQPKLGESIEAEGFRFSIAATDGRRVQRLRVERLAPEESGLDSLESEAL